MGNPDLRQVQRITWLFALILSHADLSSRLGGSVRMGRWEESEVKLDNLDEIPSSAGVACEERRDWRKDSTMIDRPTHVVDPLPCSLGLATS
jgi:hypothetical protein